MPQITTQFFCYNPLPQFEPETASFSLANAWWLSEVSRIIYKEGRGPLRNHYLEPTGLQETTFFDKDGIQCALLESEDPNHGFVIVVFRGTSDVTDWIKNVDVNLVDWEGAGQVHRGFYKGLLRVWTKLEKKLATEERPVFYCGHSLGGALAILAAAKAKVKPVAVYVYGCPRVGDAAFAESMAGIMIYRVENHLDIVTTIPPSIKRFEYVHIGQSCYIAHDNTLHIDPNETFVIDDREREDRVLDKEVDRREFYYPPESISDHAPVNYSAHLERQLPGIKD